MPDTTDAPSQPNHYSKKMWMLTAVFLTAALLWIFAWLFYFQYHETTDDAYANGSFVNINSAISGSVVSYYADNTDLVIEGQKLVELDATDYQVVYEKELAALAAVVLQVRQLYDTVTLNQAAVATKKAVLDRNKFDYERRLEVVDTGAVSVEDFVHAKDDYFAAISDLEQAESALKVAIDAAGNTPLELHPLIEQQKANVRAAYYDLMHCTIYSPITGYVAQRTVDVGEWATPPTVLMNVIPTDHVWVDANFKETQLTYMRVGQPATVTFDMYGSRVVYKGKVLGIASGTGSVFSLIPPQNATGNWIKIVQRLPVRISLDPEMIKKFPTRLGISAEVDVDISDQSLPMLVQVPSRMPVDVTTVFDIHLEVVNKKIDEVVKSAL